MFKAVFGGAFTLTYFPHSNGVPISPPTQTPVARIFDRLPSTDEIDSGSGAIQSPNAWSESTTSPYPRGIVVTAIADAGDNTKSKRYWVGLKYIPVTGGSATYDIETFELVRPEGALLNMMPSVAEIRGYDGNLKTYFKDVEIETFVLVALGKVKQTLKFRKVDFAHVENLDELKPAVIYQALTDMWSDKVIEDEPKFERWMKEAESYLKREIESVVLEYDSNKDDSLSSTEAQKQIGIVHFTR